MVFFITHFPGTSVAPFMDALISSSSAEFILGVDEAPLISMADGYARMSGRTPFIILHMMSGASNAIGALYNAYRERIPMVMAVGDADTRIMGRDAFNATPDMADLASQVSKWSWTVPRADRLSEALIRAFKVARTPPKGPVFLSIPKDLFIEPVEAQIADAGHFTVPVLPGSGGPAFDQAAELLLTADRPWVITGSDVVCDGALTEMRELAELLALPVCSARWSRLGMNADHPLYFGEFRPNIWAPEGIDLLLSASARLFLEADYLAERLVPAEVPVIQADPDPREIGKVYRADVGLISDAKRSLTGLLAAVKARMSPANEDRIASRRERLARQREARRLKIESEVECHWDAEPISQWRLSREVAEALPENGILISEVTTSRGYSTRYPEPDSYLLNSGGVLGWGMGAATGAKLAHPDRTVVAAVGDGAFLFGIQALWGAARYRLPIVVVIYNNLTHMAVKGSLVFYKGEISQDPERLAIASTLADPEVDYVSLARGFNADGLVIRKPDEIRPALERAFESNRTTVLDVRVDPKAMVPGVRTP